jgi:hypothetical protein
MGRRTMNNAGQVPVILQGGWEVGLHSNLRSLHFRERG